MTEIQEALTEEIALIKSWGLPDKYIKDGLLKTNYIKGIRLLKDNELDLLIQISLNEIKNGYKLKNKYK
jgi:hypothetical protein|tara:strand:- start:1050 stop:1256 length:207 start_codon:yes stop_codon:yes gene_type:complete